MYGARTHSTNNSNLRRRTLWKLLQIRAMPHHSRFGRSRQSKEESIFGIQGDVQRITDQSERVTLCVANDDRRALERPRGILWTICAGPSRQLRELLRQPQRVLPDHAGHRTRRASQLAPERCRCSLLLERRNRLAVLIQRIDEQGVYLWLHIFIRDKECL